MSALSQDAVGQYLNRHYIAAFQKVATFEINGGQKQGGNVASYFCTPDGQVLHAVAGPVDGGTFLREARWANETFQLAQMQRPNLPQLQAFFRKAHVERLQREHRMLLPENWMVQPELVDARVLDQVLQQPLFQGLNNAGKVHVLMAAGAMPRLEHVYQVLFERVLNEKVSTDPVAVAGR